MNEVKNIAKATLALLTAMVVVSKVADRYLGQPPTRAGRGNREQDPS